VKISKLFGYESTRRAKWHQGNGEVALQAETNDKGQTVLVVPRYHRKEIGGKGKSYTMQKPYSHQHSAALRKRMHVLLHNIVVHNMIDLDDIDPYVEDVSGASEANYRGT
jgi:hypothetical protein